MGARHPAKWSAGVLAQLAVLLPDYLQPGALCLDPFAGVGLDQLAKAYPDGRWVGTELEAEWARQSAGTLVADALRLPLRRGSVAAIVSSYCYGNRMSDHHEAADLCKACGGAGTLGPAVYADVGDYGRTCPTCKGEGLSRRNTYRHALGWPLTDGNAGQMQWGDRYRLFHKAAIREQLRVVASRGLVVVNIANHLRTLTKGGPKVEQRVTEWTLSEWLAVGCTLVEVRNVQTRKQRQGANRHRTDGERILVLRAPIKPKEVARGHMQEL